MSRAGAGRWVNVDKRKHLLYRGDSARVGSGLNGSGSALAMAPLVVLGLGSSQLCRAVGLARVQPRWRRAALLWGYAGGL